MPTPVPAYFRASCSAIISVIVFLPTHQLNIESERDCFMVGIRSKRCVFGKTFIGARAASAPPFKWPANQRRQIECQHRRRHGRRSSPGYAMPLGWGSPPVLLINAGLCSSACRPRQMPAICKRRARRRRSAHCSIFVPPNRFVVIHSGVLATPGLVLQSIEYGIETHFFSAHWQVCSAFLVSTTQYLCRGMPDPPVLSGDHDNIPVTAANQSACRPVPVSPNRKLTSIPSRPGAAR